ncbi:hypothetical protein RFI_16966 [Reticulomyxa filosa]|uniref:Uncharacterized protein n=1 Tax=Reticulomyxa filosa TaxID=46433 RepID=X6N2C5_RETFI|nr:hypothetical protein RFI_16966 [Reticulomyxa filosa]|eukprot:ETO20251.1 hypothetical protein RFI_16966 [Reticulomyxa filosa]
MYDVYEKKKKIDKPGDNPLPSCQKRHSLILIYGPKKKQNKTKNTFNRGGPLYSLKCIVINYYSYIRVEDPRPRVNSPIHFSVQKFVLNVHRFDFEKICGQRMIAKHAHFFSFPITVHFFVFVDSQIVSICFIFYHKLQTHKINTCLFLFFFFPFKEEIKSSFYLKKKKKKKAKNGKHGHDARRRFN